MHCTHRHICSSNRLARIWQFNFDDTQNCDCLLLQSVPYKYVLLRKVDNALNNPVFKAAADFLGNATDKVGAGAGLANKRRHHLLAMLTSPYCS